MIALAFLIVALVLFILAVVGVGNGRMIPAGLAFLTAALVLERLSGSL
jgi:hypothetical protein